MLQDRIVSLEHLLACLTYGKATDIRLGFRTIRPNAGMPAHIMTKFIVFRASPRGCSLSLATIEVPASNNILFDGTGAHFHRVTFSGTYVVQQCPAGAAQIGIMTTTVDSITAAGSSREHSGPIHQPTFPTNSHCDLVLHGTHTL